MKACVIGGAGFIGRSLTRQLLDSGREVVVLGRRDVPPAGLPIGVEYVSGGHSDHSVLRKLFGEVGEIFDLAYATVPQTSYADPIFDILGNLPASLELLEEARSAKLRRLVIVSSGGTVYGTVARLPIAEDTPTNPVSPYGITKLTIEKYGLMFYQQHGVPVVIVRPANAYGAGQRPFVGQGFIATAMGMILRGDEVTVFGERGTVRDYIHVDDLAAAIIAATDCGSPGEIYNIGSGVGRDNLEVLEAIRPLAESHGKTLRVKIQPARGFDVSANILDCSKLKKASGWIPKIPFADGLADMWQSISNQQY